MSSATVHSKAVALLLLIYCLMSLLLFWGLCFVLVFVMKYFNILPVFARERERERERELVDYLNCLIDSCGC